MARRAHALQDVIHKVVPGVRKYIAAALAGAEADGGKDASGIAMLQEKDPAVVEAAVGTLAARIPTLDAKRKRVLADELFALAKSKKAKLTPAGEAAVVRLAGLLDDDRVEPLLWDRVLPPLPAEVRSAAIQNLAKFIESPSKDQRAKLFQCAADPQFRVAAPAMMLLDKLPFSPKQIDDWLGLARCARTSPHGGSPWGRSAGSIPPKLPTSSSNRSSTPTANIAATCWRSWRGFRRDGRRWQNRSAKPRRRRKPGTWLASWRRSPRGTRRLGAMNYSRRFANISKRTTSASIRCYSFLREAGPAELRDRLEAKAAGFKKKEEFERALLYYKAASRDPASGFSIRLGLATVGLKLSNKELESEARAHDPSLHNFSDLIRQDELATYKEVETTKWLQADELYYLGFHFIEHAGVMGDFGGKVLKLLLKRFPKNKLAASAKSKLKSVQLTATRTGFARRGGFAESAETAG